MITHHHEIQDIIQYVYQTFYRKIYGNQEYIYTPTPKAIEEINGFINMIDETYKIESVDANFLITYFVYQVNFLINGGIEEKKNWNDKIVLTYIISKHAFERWLSRNKDFDFTIRTSPFLKMYKINLLEITNVLGKSEKDGLNRSEEHEKERFHNTLKGLTQCVLTTTLYNHRSKLCVTCNNKDDCKKLLENNYPELYKEREYVASTD